MFTSLRRSPDSYRDDCGNLFLIMRLPHFTKKSNPEASGAETDIKLITN